MIPYPLIALISVFIFSFVHLVANRLKPTPEFLSFGGGVAISYVFIDLLPKLCESDSLIHHAGFFPYFEKHVYIMALVAFLLFFVIDRTKSSSKFWLSLLSYSFFNFLIGYAVVDKNDPEVKPLALFTFAIALHFFVNDTSFRHGKWVLILSLFLGWTVGLFYTLSAIGIALVTAFIGGGVIMNVIRHEMPKTNPNNFKVFIISALSYTVLLLLIG